MPTTVMNAKMYLVGTFSAVGTTKKFVLVRSLSPALVRHTSAGLRERTSDTDNDKTALFEYNTFIFI